MKEFKIHDKTLIFKSLQINWTPEKILNILQAKPNGSLQESNRILLSLNLPPLAEATGLLFQLKQYLNKTIDEHEIENCLLQIQICLRSMQPKVCLNISLWDTTMAELRNKVVSESILYQVDLLENMLKNWYDWYDMKVRYSEENPYRYLYRYMEASLNVIEGKAIMEFLFNPYQDAAEIITLLLRNIQKQDNSLLTFIMEGFLDNNIQRLWESQIRANLNIEKSTTWINFVLDYLQSKISENHVSRTFRLLSYLPTAEIKKIINKYPVLFQDHKFKMIVLRITEDQSLLLDFILSESTFYKFNSEIKDIEFTFWEHNTEKSALMENPKLLCKLVTDDHAYFRQTLVTRYGKWDSIKTLFLTQAKHLSKEDFICYLERLSDRLEEQQRHQLRAAVIAQSYIFPELNTLTKARNWFAMTTGQSGDNRNWNDLIVHTIVLNLHKQNRWNELEETLESLSQLNIYPQEKGLQYIEKTKTIGTCLSGSEVEIRNLLSRPHTLDAHAFADFIEQTGKEDCVQALEWCKVYFQIENENEATRYLTAYSDTTHKGKKIPIKASEIKEIQTAYIHSGMDIYLEAQLKKSTCLYIPTLGVMNRIKYLEALNRNIYNSDINYDYCRFLALKQSFIRKGDLEILDTIYPPLHNEAIIAWLQHNPDSHKSERWIPMWRHAEKMEHIIQHPQYTVSQVARELGRCLGKQILTKDLVNQWRQNIRISMHGYFIAGLIEAQPIEKCLSENWQEIIPDFLDFPHAVSTNLYKAFLAYLITYRPDIGSVSELVEELIS